MKKWIIVTSIFLASLIIYLYTQSDTEKAAVQTQESPRANIKNIDVVNKTISYKDLAKGNVEIDKFKLLQQQQKASQLKENSDALIARADRLIKEHNLQSNIKLSESEQKIQTEFHEKLNRKIEKLQELNNAN